MRNLLASTAIAATIWIPAVALAQSSTTNPPAHTTPPATRPAPDAVRPAPDTANASSTATYITADKMMRASKIIGATVYNDQNQSVGSVDELLIGDNNDIQGVVLSVGGFLGINSKLVKIPASDIKVTPNRLVVSGVSRDQLKQMPDYKLEPEKS